MRIVFMGTPEFSVTSLAHLVMERHTIAGVYTRQDRPSGRGRAVASSPVKTAALSLGLDVFQPASLRGPEVAAQLAAFRPEAIVVAAYGQLLPPGVLNIPPLGCVNIHPSLLPRHRGASPVAAAILAGDEFTGVSIMRMDVGLDTGPVFVRAQVPVFPADTTGSLTGKLARVSADLLLEVLAGLQKGNLTPMPQDNEKATYTGSFSKKDGEIDWLKPADEIWRRVRAFSPWPGCFTRWQGKQLKIIQAVPLEQNTEFGPGAVVAIPGGAKQQPAFGIGAGRGVLGVLRLQLEGKQAVSSADFLRGYRQFIGSILPCG